MMQARFIQGVIWLIVVMVAYVALVAVEQSSMMSRAAWLNAQVVAVLGIGVVDVAYTMLGRAITARRVAAAPRSSAASGRGTFLVASPYVPKWLLTMLVMGAAAVLAIFGAFVQPSTFIIASLIAPPLLRSRHWGAARFDDAGIAVVWDDGLVTRLKWSALPELTFLNGEISEKHHLIEFPRQRDFRLIGRDKQPGMERARLLWEMARTTGDDAPGRLEP